jgi:signal transduction histidine kinase
LEYSTNNTNWTQKHPFNFTISPPWWRTWYFIGGCFVVALGIAFLIFRLRESNLRQKHLYLSVLNTHQQELILAEIETLERERSRIAKDLHDSIGTNLTAIKMSTNTLLKKHDEQNASIIEEQLQSTIYEIKNIIYDLVPPGLERYGLIAGLKNYIEKLKPTLEVEIDFYSFGKEVKNPKISILSFRIVQELISNSLKHARAKTITLHINSFKDSLNIVYEDDGIGFQENHHSKGSGLLNIESRIQSIHGTIQFEAGEFGVSYIIEIPVTES